MSERPLALRDAPLAFAPQNELGVVYLFAHVAKKFQLRVETVQPSFPDCLAYRRIGNSERLVRIEFELRSSNFRADGHNVRGCDCIVCWEHDWVDVPAHIEVIELKREFGGSFNVWIQPVIKQQYRFLEESDEVEWGLSKRASPGDLLLMYRCVPEKRIADIYWFAGELRRNRADWRDGDCFSGGIRRLCKLPCPILLDDLRVHRVLRRSRFIRRNMQGIHLVSEYWHYLHEMILARNPKLKRVLARFAPERL